MSVLPSQTINRYGSTAANFLEIGIGSANTAMGDAGVTFASGPTSMGNENLNPLLASPAHLLDCPDDGHVVRSWKSLCREDALLGCHPAVDAG